MDFNNYKVYLATDKLIKRKFSKEVLNKYYKQIGYLYQNGYELNCSDDEVEDQLSYYNFFNSKDDLKELEEESEYYSNYFFGKDIISEEIYDIMKNSSFSKTEASSPLVAKSYCKSNWEKIKTNLERINNLFNSNDLELIENYKFISNIESIRNKIIDVQDKINRELILLTWLDFKDLINSLYPIYIRFSKSKSGEIRKAVRSNLNDEIYGGLGGYSPGDGKIKCMVGSAVWDVKSNYIADKTKIKITASKILNGTPASEDDEEEIKFLDKWYKAKSTSENEDKKAKQIVINCLLIGIFDLLLLKHGLNLNPEDKKNGPRCESAIHEMKAILKYCCIPNQYLL